MWTGPSALAPFVPVIEHLQEAACLEQADASFTGRQGNAAVFNAAWVALFGGRGTPLREVPDEAAWATLLAAFDAAACVHSRSERRR